MSQFRTCLNASTLFPFRLTLEEQLRVAAEAGYEGIEIWVRDVEAYLEQGGKLPELRRVAEAAGIEITNAIAFWKWADIDEREKEAGLALAVRESEWLAELGCSYAAAPPYGNVEGGASLDRLAACYQELDRRMRAVGVEPVLEFWGRAKALSRLEEAIYVAERSGIKDVKLLVDPFHMYTGGSSLEDLSRLAGHQIGIVHVNDYPADPPRETIRDSDRVFPGEGVFRTQDFARQLSASGYRGFISLELFIPDFGERTALDVTRYGLATMKQAYGLR